MFIFRRWTLIQLRRRNKYQLCQQNNVFINVVLNCLKTYYNLEKKTTILLKYQEQQNKSFTFTNNYLLYESNHIVGNIRYFIKKKKKFYFALKSVYVLLNNCSIRLHNRHYCTVSVNFFSLIHPPRNHYQCRRPVGNKRCAAVAKPDPRTLRFPDPETYFSPNEKISSRLPVKQLLV